MMRRRVARKAAWTVILVMMGLALASGGAWAKLVGGVQAMKVLGQDALEIKLAVDAPARVKIVIGTNAIIFDLRAAPGQTPSKDNPIELVTGKLRISGTEVQVFENDVLVCHFPVAALVEGVYKRFCYDETKPVVRTSISPSPNANGWNNQQEVSVTVTAEDEQDGSGIALIRYKIGTASPVDVPAARLSLSEGGRIAQFTLALRDEGIHKLTFWAQDEAGNLSAPVTAEVRIDRTPPTIRPATSPQPNTYGWNNKTVTVSFACEDALSGVICPKDEKVETEGRDQSITGEAVDKAGNRTSVTVKGINIDKTPPELEVSLSSTEVHSGESITIVVRASDPLSGLDNITARDSNLGEVTLNPKEDRWEGTITPEYDGTVTVTATDKAGNTSSWRADYAMLRPPFFEVSRVEISPPDPVVGQRITVQATIVNTGHESGTRVVTLCLDGVCPEEGGEAAEPLELYGHWYPVYSVAFSPDGKTLASGSWDETIKLWDTATGEELRTLTGHTSYVSSVAFSPDGKILASASGDGTVRLWDAATGREIRRLEGHWGWVFAIAFSPDGKTVASGGDDGLVLLWDVETGSEKGVLEGHEGAVYGVAFSPSGDLLATGSEDHTVKLWDLASQRLKATLRGHQGYVLAVAFSPDGRLVASGSEDGTVRIWDSTTGNQIQVLSGHEDIVHSVAFSPDGKTLASGSVDGTVRLWDPVKGELVRTLPAYSPVYSVAFSWTGQRLAAGDESGRVLVWEVRPPGIALELGPGESDVVSFPLPPFDAPGAHTVEVKTPDHSYGPVSFQVEEPANLVIYDLTISPSELCGSGYVEVRASVQNKGGREAEDYIRFVVGDQERDKTWVRLKPGEYTSVHFSQYFSSPGWYSLTVSSRDHSASSTVRVGTPVSFSVSSLSLSTWNPCPGESVTIKATITNRGCSSGSQSIEVLVNNSYYTSRSVYLGPGASEEVSFSVSFGSESQYSVRVKSENDYSSATVYPRKGVYFDIYDLSFSPRSPCDGEQVSISVTVKNTGCDSAGQYIRFYVAGSQMDSKYVSLRREESTTVTFTYRFYYHGGPSYTIRVASDDDYAERTITVRVCH